MQQELFDVLAKARCIDELRTIKPMAQEVRAKYMDGLRSVDVKDLAIHQRWSTIREDVQRLRRCRHIRNVSALDTGDEIGYVVIDTTKWEIDTERDASEFDDMYYGKLLEKAWVEIRSYLRKLNSENDTSTLNS